MSDSFWRGRRVLVTGSTGFKGAWLALWLEQLGAKVTGLGLSPESSRGVYAALEPWTSLTHHEVDLRDSEAVARAARRADPEIVFHLAAQALVPRGYADPIGTYAINVMGTINLLEALRPAAAAAVVVVTSDKVYANSGDGRAFVESDPLGGHDPYSNSKACVELVVEGWRAAFGDACAWGLATDRAGNVIGGGDRAAARLVPDTIDALEQGRPVPLRHPAASRPWQFVLEPLRGYLLLAQRLAERQDTPPAINFGPPLDADPVPVSAVVERICDRWGSGSWVEVTSETGREMVALRLDSSRATQVLGWRPRLSLDDALRLTVDWYRAQQSQETLRSLSLDQIEGYAAIPS